MLISVVFAGLALSSLTPASSNTHIEALRANLQNPDGDIMVVAHRTCWHERAENSIAGIEACIAMGVDMIEIDVRKTRDGVLVLLHDDRLDRTTNGHGVLSQMDYADLTDLSLKSELGGEDAPLMEYQIPTLAEAFEAARGHILINLDIKDGVHDQALDLAREMGVDDQILIKASLNPTDPAMSFAHNLGRALFMPIIGECFGPFTNRQREYCPENPAAALAAFEPFGPVAYEIVYESEGALESYEAASQAYNRRVWVNTLSPNHAAGLVDSDALSDPDAVWGHILAQGADIIQTDEPAALKAYLATHNK
ncbi:glycerophosphodiester phosphodiesterase family protein [Woodsholea maritima]|uniref:glycerophosphodiester phosphodiesterase family protein n=1 Tax=Woodsholea maritima TaxID=240237 RepID=UPI0003748552|nr:glycerophosphodiester phosphodiesterase family protein [Woodsholea maritima]